jgi:hypothetical protein
VVAAHVDWLGSLRAPTLNHKRKASLEAPECTNHVVLVHACKSIKSVWPHHYDKVTSNHMATSPLVIACQTVLLHAQLAPTTAFHHVAVLAEQSKFSEALSRLTSTNRGQYPRNVSGLGFSLTAAFWHAIQLLQRIFSCDAQFAHA